MRALLLTLIAVGAPAFFTTAGAAGPDTAATLPSGPADSVQSAVWVQRKLQNFTLPLVVNSENGPWQRASCDQLYNTVKVLLQEFGARAGDITVDMRSCYSYTAIRSIDVTFWVLAPVDQTATSYTAPPVEAHWQKIQLGGNCRVLEQATRKILPLFTTRDIKLISVATCGKIGVGLYAQILKGPSQPVVAP